MKSNIEKEPSNLPLVLIVLTILLVSIIIGLELRDGVYSLLLLIQLLLVIFLYFFLAFDEVIKQKQNV